jgi:hypothetical protein
MGDRVEYSVNAEPQTASGWVGGMHSHGWELDSDLAYSQRTDPVGLSFQG